MATATPVLQEGRPEDLVLRVFESSAGTEMRLSELLAALGGQTITTSRVKAAVWELIAQGVIELTSGRKLRLMHAAAARVAKA